MLRHASLSRRAFLEASAGGLVLASSELPLNAAPAFASTPFTLGVASGDPLPDARGHLDAAGAGAAATTAACRTSGCRCGGRSRATSGCSRSCAPASRRPSPDAAHTRARRRQGLRAAATTGIASASARGRARSAARARRPPRLVTPERLRLAFVSCQRWEQGYFTALSHLAQEDLDLVFHLGDYIYEYGTPERSVRPLVGPEITTLARLPRALRALSHRSGSAGRARRRARSSSPGTTTRSTTTTPTSTRKTTRRVAAFLRRRAAAYQAYFEHMPLRRAQTPTRS